MIKFEEKGADKAKAEAAYMVGFHHGAQDARGHTDSPGDPWGGGYGSRASIAFRNWWAGLIPRKKA